jgi:hypothetical protein
MFFSGSTTPRYEYGMLEPPSSLTRPCFPRKEADPFPFYPFPEDALTFGEEAVYPPVPYANSPLASPYARPNSSGGGDALDFAFTSADPPYSFNMNSPKYVGGTSTGMSSGTWKRPAKCVLRFITVLPSSTHGTDNWAHLVSQITCWTLKPKCHCRTL